MQLAAAPRARQSISCQAQARAPTVRVVAADPREAHLVEAAQPRDRLLVGRARRPRRAVVQRRLPRLASRAWSRDEPARRASRCAGHARAAASAPGSSCPSTITREGDEHDQVALVASSSWDRQRRGERDRRRACPPSRRAAARPGRIGGGSSRDGPGISRRRSGLTVYIHDDAQADDDAGQSTRDGERHAAGDRGPRCPTAIAPQLQPDAAGTARTRAGRRARPRTPSPAGACPRGQSSSSALPEVQARGDRGEHARHGRGLGEHERRRRARAATSRSRPAGRRRAQRSCADEPADGQPDRHAAAPRSRRTCRPALSEAERRAADRPRRARAGRAPGPMPSLTSALALDQRRRAAGGTPARSHHRRRRRRGSVGDRIAPSSERLRPSRSPATSACSGDRDRRRCRDDQADRRHADRARACSRSSRGEELNAAAVEQRRQEHERARRRARGATCGRPGMSESADARRATSRIG